MLKADIRKLFLTNRKNVATKEKLILEANILLQLQLFTLPTIKFLLSYKPIEVKNEIDTKNFENYFNFKNKDLKICYPKIAENNLDMNAYDSITFEKNKFGILEPLNGILIDPIEFDLIIIPMLAFDKKGYRVGYGKGFYDKYLKNISSKCIKLGLSIFEPIDFITDKNENDIALDYCITPTSIYNF